MKIMKNVKKRWIKNVDDKYTQLFKPNEKFSSKITVFMCMTTSDSYMVLRQIISYSYGVIHHLKVGFSQNLVILVE